MTPVLARRTLRAAPLVLALAGFSLFGCAGQSSTTTVTELETGLVAAQAAVLLYESGAHPDPATVAKLQAAENVATAAVQSLVASVNAGVAPSTAALAAAQAALQALQAALAAPAPATATK